MKTLAVSLLVLLFCSFSLYSQETFKLGFTGAYPNAYNYPVFSTIDWDYYTELKMNTWQGWWIGENWHSSATSQVLQKLDDENIDGLFQPDSIRWAGYGRMQINEAEYDVNLRFRYTNHWCGVNTTDNGNVVRYFDKNTVCNEQSSAGVVLWGLSENGFQSFSGVPHDPVYQVPFPYNNYSDPGNPNQVNILNKYYVKPRMRINASDVNNNAPNKEVVKIIVKKFNGLLADSLTIYTNDFKDLQGTYDGSYKEDYKDYNLNIRGDVLNAIGETGERPDNDPAYLNDCQVDYQVYWYGEVSVWIDYVKVMDEAAYMLFNEGQNGIRLRNAIQGKINHLKNNDTEGRMKGFYMEEIDYSNLTCLKYLNENLPVWADNPNYKMIALINPGSYQAHLHTKEFSSYGEYIDMVQPPAFMNVRYNAIGDVTADIPLPVNAGITVSSSYPPGVKSEIEAIYSAGIVQNDAWYTAWLEDTSLAQVSSDMFHLGDLCKQKNIPFYFVPHYWQNGII